jgi:hypothetical protein
MLLEELQLEDNLILYRDEHLAGCLELELEIWGCCDCGARRGPRREVFIGRNLVTTAGAIYYAQNAAKGIAATVPAVTDSFNTAEWANSAGSNPVPVVGANRGDMFAILTASQKAVEAGYPRVDDPDADNAGAGSDVLSWQFLWSGPSFSAVGLSDLWLTNAAPGAAEPLLNHADENVWTPSGVFTKELYHTLKLIVNHRLSGV